MREKKVKRKKYKNKYRGSTSDATTSSLPLFVTSTDSQIRGSKITGEGQTDGRIDEEEIESIWLEIISDIF